MIDGPGWRRKGHAAAGVAHYSDGHWLVWSPPVLASATHGISAIRAISPRDVQVFRLYGCQGPSGGVALDATSSGGFGARAPDHRPRP